MSVPKDIVIANMIAEPVYEHDIVNLVHYSDSANLNTIPRSAGTLRANLIFYSESELTGSDITVRKWHIETEAYQVNHITEL